MTDYKEKLDDLHRAAKRKARELDEKLNVTGMSKTLPARPVMRRAAARRRLRAARKQLRAEAERFADDNHLRDTAGKAVD